MAALDDPLSLAELAASVSAAERLRAASHPDLPTELAERLALDDNLRVRRQAAAHPSLPRAFLDLLMRAGSSPDLAGFARSDASLPAHELERLSRRGPWGARLTARHPATDGATLEALATHPSAALRADLAAHPRASPALLERLLFDLEEAVRTRAAAHPALPEAVLGFARRAADPESSLHAEERTALAAHGAYGRRQLARRRDLTAEECARLADDPDPVVRRAVLAHPRLPAAALERAVEEAEGELAVLEIAAAHPAASGELLAWLALHAPAPVRQAVAAHPGFPDDARQRLIRAGAGADLVGFGPPDPSLPAEELARLAGAGAWTRLLAARHPATANDTLARLLCDGDPLVRQTARRNPNHPARVRELLEKAGSTPELDGFERGGGGALDPASLQLLAELGPWGRRLAARHPATSPELLERLALDPEAPVRAEAAAHSSTGTETLFALAQDLSPAVRWAVARRSDLGPEALTALAQSPEATLRAQVAAHPGTPAPLRAHLARDPDEDVRLAAQGGPAPPLP